jgi:hypothetical protein
MYSLTLYKKMMMMITIIMLSAVIFCHVSKRIPKLHQPLIPSYDKPGYVSGTVKIKS